jgi:hypothetical protein
MSAPRSEGRLSTEPTERHVANAREFLETHVRVCVPESVCNWCLRAWPCPAASWSAQVLDRAGEDVGEVRQDVGMGSDPNA